MKLSYNDKKHEYWLTQGASKKRCKSVTTLAKIPDDDFHLTLWKQRMVAVGLARSPLLLESVAAHHTDNTKLNSLCEKAIAAAGGSDRAEHGTLTHRVAERADRGEEIILTPTAKLIQENWEDALARHKLTVAPEYTERCIVYPDRLLCGKFDRALWRDDGTLVMSDLKSGTSAVRFVHGVAIQLALYAYAPLMAAQFDGLDGEVDEFFDMPKELDKKVGLIIHMPDPNEPATLHEVNIMAAQKTVEQIIWPTLAWRARKDLTRPLAA